MAKKTGGVFVKIPIYTCADALISPLGLTTAENWSAMEAGRCGIEEHKGIWGFPDSFWGGRIPDSLLPASKNFVHLTRFERLLIQAAQTALHKSGVHPAAHETVFVVATTKGNIDLIDSEQQHNFNKNRVYLWKSAQIVSEYFQNPNRPIVVSQACISGVSALLTGMQLLQQPQYQHAVVLGADVFSRFVFSGFSSFQALASERCRPFDAKRQGLNLGEAAACMVLSKTPPPSGVPIILSYGTTTNDACHLSAPSRTGEGLYKAIMKALEQLGQLPDFLNVHGTATLYNDQMESVALGRAGLSHLPVTAFKGYLGHTLGAAGLVDVIMAVHCMGNNTLLPVMGFETLGTDPVCVQRTVEKRNLRSCLKTASGFGGCNATLVMEKIEL